MTDEPDMTADELAALLAIGALDDDEIAEIERSAAQGAALGAALGLSAPPATPPAGARQRLLDAAELLPQHLSVRGEELPWRDIGIPGIEYRRLNVAPDGQITMLVRMSAGSRHPALPFGQPCLPRRDRPRARYRFRKRWRPAAGREQEFAPPPPRTRV